MPNTRDESGSRGPEHQDEAHGGERPQRECDDRGHGYRGGGRGRGPGERAEFEGRGPRPGHHEDFGGHRPGPRGGFAGRGPWGGFPGRNFWREWGDERDMGRRGGLPMGQPLSVKEMEAWREFFHQEFGTWPQEHWIFGARRFSPWHQGMDTFNPFVATLLSKGGGLLPLYVLHLVAEQPRYGNEIMEILAQRTNGQWVSNPGAIYPLLNQMESEEFIQGEWADPAKRTVRVYTITAKGQKELARIKMIVGPKLEETVQVLGELIEDLQGTAKPKPEQPAPGSDNPSEV